MSTPNICPNCGAEIPADAVRGLCPRCLLGGLIPGTQCTQGRRGQSPDLGSSKDATKARQLEQTKIPKSED